MTDDASITFSLLNAGAMTTATNVVYISDDASTNQVSLQLLVSAPVALTPTKPVPQDEAGAAPGSLLYLDLSAFDIPPTDLGNLVITTEGWQSAVFAADGRLCFSPIDAMTLEVSPPTDLALQGLVLRTAPSTSPCGLTLDAYHAPPAAQGRYPVTAATNVAAVPDPKGAADLGAVLAFEAVPSIVVTSVDHLATVNTLELTLSAPTQRANPVASSGTVFTLTAPYAASSSPGAGALMTAAQSQKISIPVPQGGSWTPSDHDSLRGERSWQLAPEAGSPLLGAAGSVTFSFGPIETSFEPGPAVLLLTYHGVDGYADGAFAVTIDKVGHARIESFDAMPAAAPMQEGGVEVVLSWQVADGVDLTLDPGSHDVTNAKDHSFRTPTPIDRTTTFTLTATGPGSGDADDRDIREVTATVLPVLKSFTTAPAMVAVDDLVEGEVDITVSWDVLTATDARVELGNGDEHGPAGDTKVPVAGPELFTLDVVVDDVSQARWASYLPAFTVRQIDLPGIVGEHVAVAPHASFVVLTQSAQNQIVVLSSASFEQIATIPCGSGPQDLAFSPDGTTLYVAVDGGIEPIAVTPPTGSAPWTFTPGAPISVGATPSCLTVSPNDGDVFATASTSDGAALLVRVSGQDHALTTLSIGGSAGGVVVAPSGRQVFAADPTGGHIAQVGIADDGSLRLVRTLQNVESPAALSVTPDGVLVIACRDGQVRLLAIDDIDASPATIEVGGQLGPIAVDPSGAYAFVGSSNRDVAMISVARKGSSGTRSRSTPRRSRSTSRPTACW